METARRSTVVKVPSEEAQEHWLVFTGESGAPGERTGEVPVDKLPNEVEKGKVYFSDEGGDSTRVTMELRYNPAVVKDAGLSDDWVSQRIDLYLRRFKEQVETSQRNEGNNPAT